MIAGVAAKRMNREQFFRAASGLDEDRLRKALWNLYWRGTAAGQSLQTYMRTKLIEGVRGRDKAEAIEILEQALASTASPGISRETIEASRRELRGG